MTEQTDKKYQEMTRTPVEKLILRLAIPSILSMLVTTVYNAADTFFIGQINTSASAAVGVCFSVMSVIQALGFFFGQGAGSSISRALGNQHAEQAEEMASVGFFSAFFCGMLLGVLGLIFLEPLVYFLGATETIFPYAVDYLWIILLGTPFMTASFVLNNLLRFQGYSFYGMIGVTTGGILNLILDPVFIFAFDMGIAGAAWATILSQMIGMILLLYLNNRHSTVKIKLGMLRLRRSHFADIVRGGLPSLLRQGIASLAVVCMNLAAKPYGDAAIAAMSIVSKITMFTNSAMLGFGQGFQPVCGYNYGARLFDRVKKGYFFCLKSSFICLVILSAVEYFFADTLVAVFRDDAQVIAIGADALRYQCLTLPTFSFIVCSNMMMQTSGKVVAASITGSARQGFVLIPLLLILPASWGMAGLLLAQPIADLLSVLLFIPFLRAYFQEMERERQRDAVKS